MFMDPARPIVLLAVPRSGSQLTRALLNTHPDVLIAGHSNLLNEITNTELSWPTVERLLEYEHNDTGRERDHVLQFLRAAHMQFWTTSGEAENTSATRWGFISYVAPPELQPVPLRQLFGEATFVHVVRDGRAVVASWLANWETASVRMPGVEKNAKEIGRLWSQYVDAGEQQADFQFRLEDLVDEERRRDTIKGLFGTCGLEPTAEVWEFAADLPRINAGSGGMWDERLQTSLARVTPVRKTLTRLGYGIE
jgi:hypothetical protein